MVVCIYHLSTQEVKAGGSEAQGHPRLHSKLEASLGYMKPRVDRIVYPRHISYFYLFVVLFFALLPVSVAESGSLCVFYRAFGLLCPACGTTRAMTNLCHFQFARAFSFNPLLVCFLAPLFFFCAAQDIVTMIRRRRGRETPLSFAEFLLLFPYLW